MTEKQKRNLLRHIRQKNLTRMQIESFCSGKTPFDRNCEITSLCSEGMIRMISEPILKTGVFVPGPEDVFELADSGKDYLAHSAKERIQIYLPKVVSIVSLVVSVIMLLFTLYINLI